VVEADDGGGMHASVGPMLSTRAGGGAPSSNLVSCISLFKKTIIVTGLTDVTRPVATLANSDGIVATGHLSVATLGYDMWL
jgi:hypothetical protein